MRSFGQDIRYSIRQLLTNPVFAAAAIITLGLGIGANTAIFSVMNAVLLRFLPVPNPSQIVYLETNGTPQAAMETGNPAYTFNFATYEHLRNSHTVFSDVMAFVPLDFAKVPVRFGIGAEEARGDIVSGNFFSGLGVYAERGRLFTREDEARHMQTVVLSYSYWTRRFNRDPSVVGQPMFVKSVPFTIIGIAQRDFIGVEPDTSATDFWIPFQSDPRLNPYGGENSIYGSPHWWFLMLMGRLQPGMTWKQALAQLNPEFQRAAYEGIGAVKVGERPPQLSFAATGGIAKLRESGENPFTILMVMVALVLLIACLNVAMLLFARNTSRQQFGDDSSGRDVPGAVGGHWPSGPDIAQSAENKSGVPRL